MYYGFNRQIQELFIGFILLTFYWHGFKKLNYILKNKFLKPCFLFRCMQKNRKKDNGQWKIIKYLYRWIIVHRSRQRAAGWALKSFTRNENRKSFNTISGRVGLIGNFLHACLEHVMYNKVIMENNYFQIVLKY